MAVVSRTVLTGPTGGRGEERNSDISARDSTPMDGSLVDKAWDDIGARVGDDLRAVTEYRATEHEVRMREDMRELYDSGESQSIVDDTIVYQLSGRTAEGAFKAGRLRAFVRVFDDSWVLAWTKSLREKTGFIVSIDRGDDGRPGVVHRLPRRGDSPPDGVTRVPAARPSGSPSRNRSDSALRLLERLSVCSARARSWPTTSNRRPTRRSNRTAST
jgi:hypothetical protein